jgi:hypothetical protein
VSSHHAPIIRVSLAVLALLATPVLAQVADQAQSAPAADPATPVTPAAPAEPAEPAEEQAPAAPVAPAAEAGEEDMGAEEGLEEESPEPPPGFTGVWGRVTDAANGEALIEATVKVVSGAKKQTLTDIDGYYKLKLPPGTYDLRVFYDVYEGRRVTGVVVQQGKATKLEVQLSSDSTAVQEVVVEAKADKRAEGAVLQERKRAAAVSDAISSQEIARTPDSSAGDAVKRVVSATVVDGRYVLLRGLGGRYSVTLLNGALLPSLEPDEASVPLDIFPTNLLSNLNAVKSYTADLPGTFGGGVLQIETNSYPSSFEFRPRLSLSGNSVTTFQARNTHTGGPLEWLSFTDGSRALPAQVPTDGPVIPRQGLTREQVDGIGRAFPVAWSASQRQALPNLGLGASLGDTLRLGNQRLGYLFSLNYGYREQVQQAFIGAVNTNDEYQEQGQGQLGVGTYSLSGLANVGFLMDRDNELTFFSLYTRALESRTETISGFNNNDEEDFDSTRLQFIERSLSFNQLRGFHRLNALGDMEVDWQANFSRVDRNEPDTRDTSYFVRSEGREFENQTNSGARFFFSLGENSTGGSLNLTLPLQNLRLKAGGTTQLSFRDFELRRFRYYVWDAANVDGSLPPEQLFAPDLVGNGVRFEERTLLQDSYDGFLGIYAGYVNADYKPLESLRLVGGVRYEASQQTISARSPYDITSQPPVVGRANYGHVLPSVNAIYALSPTANARLGYSFTIARPTFRELAPFLFFDFVRRRAVSGNPGLVATRVHNVDARVEWFPGESEVFAASLFGKQFLDPIERIFTNGGGQTVTFNNTQAAQLYGAELEARAGLGRLSPVLNNLRAAVNLTLLQSRIILSEDQQRAQTNRERPLQGQSPYVVNVNLGYSLPELGAELSALYNVYGPRVADVGVQGLQDAYEQPFHRVDLTYTQKLPQGFQLKLTGANLLDSSVVITQGSLPVLSYKPGVTVSAQLGWSP